MTAPAARAQPSLAVSLDRDIVRVGRPFVLTVDARWLGAPERYVLYPPSLELPDGVRQGELSQTFATQGSETVYRYRFQLTATSAGNTDLGKVSLEYRDMKGKSGAGDRGTLEEPLPRVVVRPGGVRAVLAGMLPWLILAALLLIPFLWLRKRTGRKRRGAEEGERDPEPTALDLLEQARNRLVEGDLGEVYTYLIAIKPHLPPAEDPLPGEEALEAERLRARYGGVVPGVEDLRRLLRDVELVLRKGESPG